VFDAKHHGRRRQQEKRNLQLDRRHPCGQGAIIRRNVKYSRSGFNAHRKIPQIKRLM
jgi:hypothetical protein